MNEKPVKVDVGFDEALRRIANTPKNIVVNSANPVDATTAGKYNEKAEAPNKEPPLTSVKK